MLREALLSLVLAVSALALVSAAPAPVGCDTFAALEDALQNDAGSGLDAPDTPADALRVASDGYYFGYLSTIGHANADREDWYVYAVPDATERMRANVTEAFPLVPGYAVDLAVYLQMFTLTVWPPNGGAPLSITSAGGTLVIPGPAPGDYLVRVSATTIHETDACDGSIASAAPPLATQARNHGMYLGCDPICAEGGPMHPMNVQTGLGL